jgi:hypothetical protein
MEVGIDKRFRDQVPLRIELGIGRPIDLRPNLFDMAIRDANLETFIRLTS